MQLMLIGDIYAVLYFPFMPPAPQHPPGSVFVVVTPSESGTGLTLTVGARRREKLVAVEQRCEQRHVMVEQKWASCMKINIQKKPNLLNETVGGPVGKSRKKDEQISSVQMTLLKSFCCHLRFKRAWRWGLTWLLHRPFSAAGQHIKWSVFWYIVYLVSFDVRWKWGRLLNATLDASLVKLNCSYLGEYTF